MDDCPITVRYGDSATMLKHQPPGRVNACEKPSRPPKDTFASAHTPSLEKALGGTRLNVTVSTERA
eukprot:5580590-Prymnesium_polylepis.1